MRKLLILPGSHIIVWGYRRRSSRLRAYTFSRSYAAYAGRETRKRYRREARDGSFSSLKLKERVAAQCRRALIYIPAIFFDHRALRTFISEGERSIGASSHLIASYYLPKDSNIVTRNFVRVTKYYFSNSEVSLKILPQGFTLHRVNFFFFFFFQTLRLHAHT